MTTKRALCLIRDALVYRRGAFVSGLRAAGYEVDDRLFHLCRGEGTRPGVGVGARPHRCTTDEVGDCTDARVV